MSNPNRDQEWMIAFTRVQNKQSLRNSILSLSDAIEGKNLLRAEMLSFRTRAMLHRMAVLETNRLGQLQQYTSRLSDRERKSALLRIERLYVNECRRVGVPPYRDREIERYAI